MQSVQMPPKEAIQRGLLFYFGKPCINGHIGKRYISNRQCLGCSDVVGKVKAKVQYLKHREKRLQYAKEYREKNAAVLSKKSTEYSRAKRKSDPAYVLKARLQARCRDALKAIGVKKNSRTEEMLGCSFADFRSHIEKQFARGMNWEDASAWHIDHIIPCASAESVKDLHALFHFTNLRPVWAADNLAKKDKVLFLL
jgi:hypothetical protein